MQATIPFPVVDKENISNAASKKSPRKRPSMEAIDLTKEFDASSLVVEAMKQRIFQLEDELEAARSVQVQGPPAKRARTSTLLAEPSSRKKRKMQLRKIFDRIKKDRQSDTAEFDGLFGGKGVFFQSTPQNEPKSATTKAQIAELFGDELKVLKGNRWTRGGLGACNVEIGSVELNYSSNNMKYSLRFKVYEVAGGRGDDMFLW
ncbi:hypothetical protein DFS33DRAFT_1371550 [Desarmillaria ectypa]|nr:hypothetical protein DFS33DRAFT_1371550 [Desarmillaria ectypa]